MNKPLVSVITPAYLAEDFIESTIQSVWLQRYRPLEHIVVVDGSPDATAARAHQAAERLDGEGYRLRIIDLEENSGTAAALNTAVAHTSGDFVSWLSADDMFANRHKTSRQVADLQSEQTVAGVFDTAVFTGPELADSRLVHLGWTRAQRLSPGLRHSNPADMLMGLMFRNPINGTSITLRRSAMPEGEWFDSALGRYAQDGDLWMRLSATGRRLAPSRGAGSFYRAHPGQFTHTGLQHRVAAIATNRILLTMSDQDRLVPWLRRSLATFGLSVMGRAFRFRPAPMATLRALVPQAPDPALALLFRKLDAELASFPDEQRKNWAVWMEEAGEMRSSDTFRAFEEQLKAC